MKKRQIVRYYASVLCLRVCVCVCVVPSMLRFDEHTCSEGAFRAISTHHLRFEFFETHLRYFDDFRAVNGKSRHQNMHRMVVQYILDENIEVFFINI